MAAKDEPDSAARRSPRRSAWRVLLLVPFTAPVLTIALPNDHPGPSGIPLVYTLHFACCLVSMAVTALVQHLAKDV
ncbi:hypothetical protein AB0I10_37645 [Streptomyces sp. NPDC050636]|uniref:hypothetical protein n=1 Tax=Streptomyces sp. NPDC050636 TaxID=3154510 RepID=UPI00343737D1